MQHNDILKINKKGWDHIAKDFFGTTALPQYGPLIATEDELNLFQEVRGKKVLDMGCGSGHSLAYMAKRGAQELWGVDLSTSQIAAADKFLQENGYPARLFSAPMEEDIDLPKDYFDIVYSIYAIGWTTDLPKTLTLFNSYLKKGGILVFSWDHPMYQCITTRGKEVIIEKSYLEEDFECITKKEQPIYINRIKMSTYINELVQAGFEIEKVIEGDLSERFKNRETTYSGKYYTLHRARVVPSSLIIKARKK